MQLPPLDRIPTPRPVAAELAAMAATKVIPVAAVNPSSNAVASTNPAPSVINLVGQVGKSIVGEGVYSSVSDPARRGSEAATAPKDWTIHRPAPEKVEDPPPVPIAKILIDHIKSLWLASASAVQVQQQVRSQLDLSQPNPSDMPGALAKESVTYTPSKINKTENI